MQPKYARQYTKREMRKSVFVNPSDKRMAAIKTSREIIIKGERNRVPAPKRPSLRQLSQRLRPSHITLGDVYRIDLSKYPDGALIPMNTLVPSTLVENNRKDHSRAERELVRMEARRGV